MAHGRGSRQQPPARGMPEDQQTDVRLSGMESCTVGQTRPERVGYGYVCMAPAPMAYAGGLCVQARTADRQRRARGS
jgi:hypothetical protein